MTDHESQMQRLQEYKEFKERETRFTTVTEFKEFCKNNHVFFNQGFGGKIQQLIHTEKEFVDFCLKCCTYDHGDDSFPWFLNDYRHDNEENLLFFKEVPDVENMTEEELETLNAFTSDGEYAGSFPTVPITAYYGDYNQYYDDPFSVVRVDEYKTYPEDTFVVNPTIAAKFPAIVRFVSMDTWDRMGSIKGDDFEIISLKDVEDGIMMFL